VISVRKRCRIVSSLILFSFLAGGLIRADLHAQTSGAPTATAARTSGSEWWKRAVIYEVYPRSFQDSNGDGIGDLNGITERLDYLQALGIDAIWLSPVYPSPQIDFGYDISDYEAIDPQYGTLADFDKLVAEAKKRNIRIIMDMVLNHTSDKHPWFEESKSSKTNGKRDWYVWRDGKGQGVPPNNWESVFGHSAWQFDVLTNQWYYHKFYIHQPDLNWRNPAVENAMFASMRFWLDRGVAGFRLDAIPTLFEDPQLRDAKVLPGTNAFGDPNVDDVYTDNLPEVHGVMKRMRAMVSKYPGDRVLIGETYLPNVEELDKWYGGTKRDELNLPMDMQMGFTNQLNVGLLRSRIEDAESKIHGNQPLFVFDNHDNPRSWERYGDGLHNDSIARLIATILFTTRATSMMYYGQELGMMTSVPKQKSDVKDPVGVTGWPKDKGRDGERTPMQWTGEKNAGFSTAASTWLPVAADYKTVNVEAEKADPNSLLNWYMKLIEMRRKEPAIRDGSIVMLDTKNTSVLSYIRYGAAGKPSIVVALNFTGQSQTISLEPKNAGGGKTVHTILTNDPALSSTDSLSFSLAPFATWVGSIQ
jgi:alpha-glucosidase